MASVADQGSEVEHIIQDAGSEGIHQFFDEQKRSLAQTTYQPRLFVERDQGMYDAVNRGLGKSSGDICGYLNSDEQYLPGTLARVNVFFRANQDAEVCFGHAIIVDSAGEFIAFRKAVVPGKYHTWVSKSLAVLTCATFFRRSVFEQHGLFFDPKLKTTGDAEWVMRMKDMKIQMAILPSYVAAFSETDENLDLGPEGARDKADLVASAPLWARLLKPMIISYHRGRRFLGGAYSQKPFSYDIYTLEQPERRTAFNVAHPTSRWRR